MELQMLRHALIGWSAVFASTPATAGGDLYYGAPAYYAPPPVAYAPPVYYAPVTYPYVPHPVYYAPPVYAYAAPAYGVGYRGYGYDFSFYGARRGYLTAGYYGAPRYARAAVYGWRGGY